MQKFFGWLMLVAFFGVILGAIAWRGGTVLAAIVAASSIAGVAWIWLAMNMIHK